MTSYRMHLPVTISIHRGEVESLFLPNFDLSYDNSINDILLPLNLSNIDWYLISSSDSKMSPLLPSPTNSFTSTNSTAVTSSMASTTPSPMPLVQALPVALVLSSIVVLCICGNILVILSVFTFRPLRTVQNFFIVSLAFSDMFIAIMVMPFHIVRHILDRWVFGEILCQIFVTSDVLLCTSSILNLSAIALDRYWAISDPIQYARKRTIRRVLFMIMLVWVLSATISIPPIIITMLGSSRLQTFDGLQCDLSRNTAYVIYSACGSFYIPALIITIVYVHVFVETKKRFRERANAAAKLVNATRVIDNEQPSLINVALKNNSIAYKQRHRHNHRKNQTHKPSPLHTMGASFKSLASNGSGVENFSTDDADETIITKVLPSSNNNSLVNWQTKSKDDLTIPSINENDDDNSSINQQQNAAVQTSELLDKTQRLSKDAGRRSLFKGKSLSALMNERQKISLTRERRLSRTLGIIISVFLLCWLPFFVVYLISAFDKDIYGKMQEPFSSLILWLGYMNSACNPLIYTVFNVEFRTAFKRLLCPHSTNNTLSRTNTNKQSRR
ncbi:unnamed protein product [Adineta steineri]|uniref:G-protein coupled receptors family 1 profile domain-containing protein n=1 Tax=Adineta steineri TaxID=433720 RepID=A0A814M916_9BILA|nr:unnamed protein product [Adineta steineri]CAF3847794.1 unnamed protein product [Adineta steineri]